jgi:hypothetical protein
MHICLNDQVGLSVVKKDVWGFKLGKASPCINFFLENLSVPYHCNAYQRVQKIVESETL